MATKTWTGASSTAWTTAANWTGGVPVAGDDVVITTAGTNAPTLSASTSIGSLSFTGTKTLTLSGTTVLTVTGVVPGTTFGVNFTGTSDLITGAGTVSATNGINVATGGSATITTTGTLTVTGALSKAGTGTLALSITGNNAVLALTSAGSSVTSVTFNGTVQSRTLQLGANATLTVANAITLSDNNHFITLGGPNSALTDLAGITFTNTGTISGAGTVTGAVTAGTQAAHITANGGTLIMASAVTGSNLILATTASTDTLQFNAAGNTAATLTLNNGTLKLNGATAALSVTNSTTLGTGTITGFGTFTGTVAAAAAAGHVTANGGTLVMAGQVTGTALLLVDTASTDTLQFNAAGNTASSMTLNGGTLRLNAATTTLAVTNALAIGTGTVNLVAVGATLTDNNGLTLAGGTITGLGSIAANTNISGFGTVAIPISTAGSITANGGVLDMQKTVTGRTLTITGSGDTLQFDAAGNTTTSLTMNGGTLKLNGASTTLTDTAAAALAIGAGTVNLVGGASITDANNFTITTGTITGAGTVNGTVAAGVSAGHVTANGGALVMAGAVTGSALLLADTAATDTLQFNAAGNTASSLTLNGGTLRLNAATTTLAVTNQVAIGTGTVNLVAAGATLTDAAGLTLAGGSIVGLGGVAANTGISGFGNVGISVVGRTVTASGGTLDVTGAMSNTSVLAIANVANSVLKIDNGGVTINPVTVDTANKTLEIAQNATINAAQTITGGTLVVDSGATLTDAAGITLSSGTVSGAGSVAAGTNISGSGTVGITISTAGTITASGGTLDLTGTVSGRTLVINTTAGSDLKIDGTTTSAPITINNANQTLEIGAAGALTIAGAESITNGTITMSGGTLTDSSGVTLGTGSHLTGFGTFNPTFTGSNSGIVTAAGGTLALTSNVTASSGLTFDIFDSASSVLKLNGSVGAANTFDFLGTHGALELNDVTIAANGLNFAGAVDGLDVAASATPDLSTIDYINVQATITKAVLTDSTHIELFNNATDLGTITLATATTATHVDWFADSGHPGGIIGSGTDVILSNDPCYLAGTRILTATGERMVETLMQGDIVLTLTGDELSAQPVKWIGRRRIDLTAHPRPETVAPVRIRRGAFADNMPHSDLLVSPDHAIFVEGKLICARQLINGSTIRQEQDVTSLEYFHVELATHAILVAEGLPAESYLNTGNHGFFTNSGEPLVLHPDLTDESDYPTRAAGSCAPFVWDEASVLPVWQHLAERAAALGQPAPQFDTTTDPELRIVAKGRSLRPLYGENGLYIFALPKGATEVRVVSRAGSPTDARPWLDDRRRLGVQVERIMLRGASEVRDIALDHPDLSQGWWAAERDGTAMRRWTNGEAVLPLPALGWPTMLEIRASNGGMSYVTNAEPERRVA